MKDILESYIKKISALVGSIRSSLASQCGCGGRNSVSQRCDSNKSGSQNKLNKSVMKLFKQDETYISEKVRLKGDIDADADISIDGEMQGNIRSTKHVMLGATSHFEGNIESQSALVCGTFKGRIVAKSWLKVTKPAVIIGDLIADSVRLDSGVAIQGRILAKSVMQDGMPSPMPDQEPITADSKSPLVE